MGEPLTFEYGQRDILAPAQELQRLDQREQTPFQTGQEPATHRAVQPVRQLAGNERHP